MKNLFLVNSAVFLLKFLYDIYFILNTTLWLHDYLNMLRPKTNLFFSLFNKSNHCAINKSTMNSICININMCSVELRFIDYVCVEE